jgi:hypothetical protein
MSIINAPLRSGQSGVYGAYSMGQPTGGGWEAPFQELFFGTKSVPPSDRPYEYSNRTTLIGSEGGFGLSHIASQTIDDLVQREENWHLQDIAPIELLPIEVGRVSWSEIKFDQHVARSVPELGAPDIVSSQRIERSTTFSRVGKGYYLEDSFLSSPMGAVYHAHALMQLAYSILETVKFDVVFTLLHAQDVEREWFQKRHGSMQSRQTLPELLADDCYMFAAMQKFERPLHEIDSFVTKRMDAQRGVADTWILPESTRGYLQLAIPAYTDQSIAGEYGPRNVFDKNLPIEAIVGARVFFSRVYYDGGRIDPLERRRQIGEVYRMCDPDPDDTRRYTSASRDISIYNEESNNWQKITLSMALKYSNLFDEDGNLAPVAPRNGYFPEHMRKPETQTDLFHAPNTRGQKQYKCKYFGQVPLTHIDVKLKIGWAETVRNHMRRSMGELAYQKFESDYEAGIGLLRRIELEPMPEDIVDILQPGAISNIGEAFQLQQLNRTRVEYFGHQSYYGFQRMASMPGYGLDHEIAANFLTCLSQLAGFLRQIGGASAYYDANYALRWDEWNGRGTAEQTLFETLVMPPRHPVVLGGASPWTKDEILVYQQDILRRDILLKSDKVDTYETTNAPRVTGIDLSDETTREIVQTVFLTIRAIALRRKPLTERERTEFDKWAAAPFATSTTMTAPPNGLVADTVAKVANSLATSAGAAQVLTPLVASSEDMLQGNAALYDPTAQAIARESKATLPIGAMFQSDTLSYDDSSRNNKDFLYTRPPEIGKFFKSSYQRGSWNAISAHASSHLSKTIAHVFDSLPIKQATLQKFIDNDLLFPFDFYVARPHMTYLTQTGVKVAGRGRALRTYVKPGEMKVGHDATAQATFGTVTHSHTIVTLKPQNVFAARDISLSGYVGGGNTEPIDVATYDENIDWETARGSLIFIPASRNERLGNYPLLLTGTDRMPEFGPYDVHHKFVEGNWQYLCAPRIEGIFGFWNKHQEAERFAIDEQSLAAQQNVICWPGDTLYRSRATGQFDCVAQGTGHFGGWTSIGCNLARQGRNTQFKRQSFEHYSVVVVN